MMFTAGVICSGYVKKRLQVKVTFRTLVKILFGSKVSVTRVYYEKSPTAAFASSSKKMYIDRTQMHTRETCL